MPDVRGGHSVAPPQSSARTTWIKKLGGNFIKANRRTEENVIRGHDANRKERGTIALTHTRHDGNSADMSEGRPEVDRIARGR